MNETLEALLEAHVQHELASLRGEPLERLIEDEVSHAFDWFSTVTLNQVVSREAICGVIERYVTEFQISGGITELAGEMSRRVASSTWSASTELQAIIPNEFYEAVVDKLVELAQARPELAQTIAESPAYAAIVSQVLHRSVMEFLFAERRAAPSLFAAEGRDVARRVVPSVERKVAARLTRFLDGRAERFARSSAPYLLALLDEKGIRRFADELWQSIAPMHLSELFAHLDDRYDLDDFIVIGYEFWRKYRKTDYFREIARELVGHFFDKYGEEKLLTLVEDMGVSDAIVLREIRVFSRPVIDLALATGFLEARLRAHLRTFYTSDAAAAIVEPSL